MSGDDVCEDLREKLVVIGVSAQDEKGLGGALLGGLLVHFRLHMDIEGPEAELWEKVKTQMPTTCELVESYCQEF